MSRNDHIISIYDVLVLTVMFFETKKLMKHLRMAIHLDLHVIDSIDSVTQKASRAIVINGDRILLIYTERYDDYTLPGGGLNEGEDIPSQVLFVSWKKKPERKE